MKVVVDLSKEEMEAYKNLISLDLLGKFGLSYSAIQKIINGTPLPKGHGRLIDADALKLTQHDIHVESINYRHRCISVENITLLYCLRE